MIVTDVMYMYRRSTPMGDPIDGAIFNKCDPVMVGNSSRLSVSVENNLCCTDCKIFKQISTNKLKDTQVHV